MNRFKNGWFTLYKFTEKVAEDRKYHDELVEFSKSNTIDQPEYLDPVIIFTARRNEGEVTQRSEQRKPKVSARKVNLTIGIDDNDAEGGPSKREEPKADSIEALLAPVLEVALPAKKVENKFSQDPPKSTGKPGLSLAAPTDTFQTKTRPKPSL